MGSNPCLFLLLDFETEAAHPSAAAEGIQRTNSNLFSRLDLNHPPATAGGILDFEQSAAVFVRKAP